jgi:ferrous iron transport protein A
MSLAAAATVDVVAQTAAPARHCTDLQPGEQAVIASLGGSPALRARLQALGIRPGLQLKVVRRAPWGCPIEVEVRHVHLALRREDAEAILITPRT